MDDDYAEDYGPRLPLISLCEAREAVRLLLHFRDETTEEGQAAGDLAHDLALRLPAD
ncbi:hypothetical protein [Streptomyces hydrogenans]|uniref:Uncharacterized protein n=1 Tax=Streptomyces hydrogenans TaxID=1873719 RepID=A0ABQ3PJH7_9ACTN|nr:hypothetical protein [Streptomyces hydrogenans]GHG10283.1 hypothetical protein GCM10018784_23770 [Streptomyces hydrogenans]GHI25172.1 hypothetical protein Shyd_65430 [Streptomyces hydrogenans]